MAVNDYALQSIESARAEEASPLVDETRNDMEKIRLSKPTKSS